MDPALGLPDLFSVFGSLVVILAALGIFAVVAKKFRSRSFRLRDQPMNQINVIATRSFGSQTCFLIVEAEGKRFLLAKTRQGVTLISALGNIHAQADMIDPSPIK